MKKLIILGLLIAALVAGFFLSDIWGERYVVVITEEELVQKLDDKFPIQKRYFLIIYMRFENPKLELDEESNRIQVGCDVVTSIGKEQEWNDKSAKLRGTALISGDLQYEKDEGAFYLASPEIMNLHIDGLPKIYTKQVDKAAARLAKEYLVKKPVYRLKDTSLKQAAAKLILQDVLVEGNQLKITLGIGEK